MDTVKDQLRELVAGHPEYDVEKLFEQDIMDVLAPAIRMYGSSDVADVSWVVPTSHFGVVVDATGTPAHSWQRVAQGKSSVAHKGLVAAAKVLAMSVLDFLENPALVSEAKKDFEKELGGQSYTMLLPEDLVPGSQH